MYLALFFQAEDVGESYKNSWYSGVEVSAQRVGNTSSPNKNMLVHDCLHANLQPGSFNSTNLKAQKLNPALTDTKQHYHFMCY